MNYLIDEVASCGKGANATASFLHNYLESFSIGENFFCSYTVTTVHVGQNKAILYLVSESC